MIKNFSDSSILLRNDMKSIFLAGPTSRKFPFEMSWRKEACKILEENGFDGIVYIPEYEVGDNPMEFDDQVEWERDGLMNSDVIVFYIPRKLPNMPGFTTNVEYGMYLARRPDNVILCIPPDSEKNRYLEWLYTKEKPKDIVHKDLETVLIEAIKRADEISKRR